MVNSFISMIRSKKGFLESNILKLILFVALLFVIMYILLRVTGVLDMLKCGLKTMLGGVC